MISHEPGRPIRATAVKAGSDWTEPAVDSVVLDFDDRHRRRIAMTGTRGLAFLLDLPEAVALRGGDALVLEDGRLVEVVAAPETLIEVRAHGPGDLVRLAWHVGNRHIPAQIAARALRIRGDHVIEAMLRQLGAKLTEIEAPFDPEGGAYAASSRGSDDHAAHDRHGDDHHDHKHEHAGDARDHSPDGVGHGHKHDH